MQQISARQGAWFPEKTENPTMANETATKQPTLQQRIAARQAKRAEVGKEAQIRVAAAYTIAKTMLPTAPVEIRKKFASVLLGASTKTLKVALRQTAINAHNTKLAETLKEVHKVELNQLLEPDSVLNTEKNAVKSELKGDAKSATTKVADDRKEAGPQPAEYNEGARKEPTDLDADNAGKRKAETVDKTEGGEKIQDAVQDSARAKEAAAKKADIMGGTPAPVSAPAAKPAGPAARPAGAPSAAPAGASATPAPSAVAGSKAEIRASAKKAGHVVGCKCADCEKVGSKESSEDGKPNSGEVLQTKAQTAAVKKADEIPGAMGGEAPAADAPAIDAPADGAAPEGEAGPEAAEALQQDDTKAVLIEKVQEAEQAVQAIEQEITKEETEEVDLTGLGTGEGLPGAEAPMEEPMDMENIFSDANLTEKASNLANEHHEGADEDYFAPSASSELEANLDEPQMASLEDMFSHEASADPMASLFEKSAASVEGFEVVPSSTGEAANKMKAEHGSDNRDNTSDHDEDILSLLVEGLDEQSDDQERVKQDSTPELETASKEASAKKTTLKHIKASSGTVAAPAAPDLADVLFASIDSIEDERNDRNRRR